MHANVQTSPLLAPACSIIAPPHAVPALRSLSTISLPLFTSFAAFCSLGSSALLDSAMQHTQLTHLQLAHCGLLQPPGALARFTRLHELDLQGARRSCMHGIRLCGRCMQGLHASLRYICMA